MTVTKMNSSQIQPVPKKTKVLKNLLIQSYFMSGLNMIRQRVREHFLYLVPVCSCGNCAAKYLLISM